jgi:hypothetical protein
MAFRPLKSFFPTADELLEQDLATLGRITRQRYPRLRLTQRRNSNASRSIQRGDLYVEHRGACYHPDCAVKHGLVQRAPMRQCPNYHQTSGPEKRTTRAQPAAAAAGSDYYRG